MNKYQRLIVVVTLIDALVMIIFPPFNDTSLVKGALPSFEGFYPLIMQFGRRPISFELLTIQLLFVAINALLGYLCLRTSSDDEIPEFNFNLGIICFAVVDLAIMLLFPPFEPYRSLVRSIGSSFDSFYFVWGERSNRAIFAPLLHLEIVFLAVNMLALWLLFNTLRRSDDAYRDHLLRLAETMDETELAKLTAEMRRRVEAHHADLTLDRLGRGSDRRHEANPGYDGDERRHGSRRTR